MKGWVIEVAGEVLAWHPSKAKAEKALRYTPTLAKDAVVRPGTRDESPNYARTRRASVKR